MSRFPTLSLQDFLFPSPKKRFPQKVSFLMKYLKTFAFVFIGLSRCYKLDFSIYLKRYHFTWRANRVSWGNVKCFKRQKSELRMGSLNKISMWPRTCTWTLFKSVLSFFRALAWYIIDMSKICRYYKGSCQKRFSGFFPLRGYPPPPYPLNGKSFCQKTLSGKGGYPPPP